MNQSIVDEAKRLAIKDLDYMKLNHPYTLEKGLLAYFRGINIDLEANFNRWFDDNKANSIKRYTKELTNKNEVVKQILIDNFYIEYYAPIYKTAKQLFSERTDDAVYYMGEEEKPKRVGWNETIKDTHPNASLQYNLKGYLDNLKLYQYWHEKEEVIISNLKSGVGMVNQVIAGLRDVKTDHRWPVRISIMSKER